MKLIGGKTAEEGRPGPPFENPFAAQAWLLRDIPAPRILDIGAHVGKTVERYARVFPRAAAIHAVEPFEEAFAALEEVVRAIPNADAHRVAIGAEDGEARLHVSPGRPDNNSLLPRPRTGRRYYPSDAELEPGPLVLVETLDGFCARRGIGQVDLLKIDVQGTELDVIRGGSTTLRSIGLVFAEVNFAPQYEGGVLYLDLGRALADLGFSIYNLFNLRYGRDGQVAFGDAIFLSADLRARALDGFSSED